MHPVPTFSEQSVREAILNAVSHRDYRHPGSVFVRQFPRRIEIVSPGGFPAGVTPENILYRQNARNRLIADNLARCGLVERAGQGANRMFAESVRQGKRLPDFTHTDQFQVSLTLHGQIQDPDFLRFLEKVGPDRVEAFAVEDLLVLDRVHREQRVPDELRERLRPLIAEGRLSTTCEVFLEDNLALDGAGNPVRLTTGTYTAKDSPPTWPPSLRGIPSSEVRQYVLSNAGARPWDRDAVDRRIVQQVRDGKGRIPDSEQEVGGYPNLPESRRPFDVSQWDLSTMTSR